MRISSDDIDTASVDAALSTTRAVRFRLDLERDVDQQIILDCIDIAEQAPSGGNQGSRRWVVVRDEALKARLAELYMASAGRWMVEARDKLVGTGHHNERVMGSAAHLAEHLAEVPAIVIPTIIGRHDNSGRPGLFDSVIQSAWSFSVALRARGLGTAWTTAILNSEDEIAELLDIPEGMTQIAMLPVAWTKGTEFSSAPRYEVRDITYVDGFGRIYDSGPSSPISIADGPGAVVEVDIKAPISRVWELVSDISMPAAFSEEFVGAQWAGDADDTTGGVAVGAKFIGRNTHEARGEWEVPCFVNLYEEEKVFGWVTSDLDNPGARWRFELERIAGSVRVRFILNLGPGPSGITEVIAARPELEAKILNRRISEHRANMQRVLDGLVGLI
ncbi:MAG: nitroreductase family protein [Acidimicrobiales bacterium]